MHEQLVPLQPANQWSSLHDDLISSPSESLSPLHLHVASDCLICTLHAAFSTLKSFTGIRSYDYPARTHHPPRLCVTRAADCRSGRDTACAPTYHGPKHILSTWMHNKLLISSTPAYAAYFISSFIRFPDWAAVGEWCNLFCPICLSSERRPL